jgi:hypothetical protein
MARVDTLNFRGKYRQYDVDGKPYLYFIGDTVEHNAQIYVAVRPTSTKVPGTQEGKTYWKETGGNFGFFIQETPPSNADIGDRWYVPSTAILYTYVKEESHKFWVEL